MSNTTDNSYLYELIELPNDRVNALIDLITLCREENVEIKCVLTMQHGFIVHFEGLPGDAALHDGTYGRYTGQWETYKMPWDYGDVSVHSSASVAKMLGALKRGEPWEKYEEEE